MRKAVLSVCLSGALLLPAIPAQAHHRKSFVHLRRRITRLETQMGTRTQRIARLERKTKAIQGEVAATQDRVTTIEGQAQLLDEDGFYFGPVLGSQVLALCPAGSQAIWRQLTPGFGARQLDDCISTEGEQQSVSDQFQQ